MAGMRDPVRFLGAVCLCLLMVLPACSDDDEEAEKRAERAEVQLSEAELEAEAFVHGRIEPHREDLAGIRKRRVLRALVIFSPTEFLLLNGKPHGFQFELMSQYEKFLNKGVWKKKRRTQDIYVPLPLERLIPALREGEGDIIAAGLTVTPEREKLVAFAAPYLPAVDEIVVTHKSVEGLNGLEDLAGRKVHVMGGSTYAQHMRELSDRFQERGLPRIDVVEADDFLSTGDILEMVNAGIFDITVSDAHIADVWSEALAEVTLRPDLQVHSGGKVAWAVRRENKELRDSLDAFMKSHKKGSKLGNILFTRYFEDTTFVNNPLTDKEIEKFEALKSLFRRYGDKYQVDWLASMAQGYQESGLDQKKRSKAGAVGIMQLLPSTAADPNVNIKGIDKAENNIHAGIKYTAFLRDRYFSDPEIDQEQRLAFAFAAYNLGPNRVDRLRQQAKAMGFDPNRWFGNVEMVALAKVGREPVRYVGNIHEYYVAYRLHERRLAEQAETAR